ncbi:MAG: hypothetical protein ABIJ59_19620 [Pseudomonadota bacterium]
MIKLQASLLNRFYFSIFFLLQLIITDGHGVNPNFGADKQKASIPLPQI